MNAKKKSSKTNKTKARKNQAAAIRQMYIGLLLLSGLFALFFAKGVIRASQGPVVDMLDAQNVFLASVAFVLAVYIWFTAPYPVHRYRYGVLVVAASLLTSYVLWFFGVMGFYL